MAKEDLMSIFEKVAEEVRNDLSTKKLADEFQLKYGVMTENDLRKAFSI